MSGFSTAMAAIFANSHMAVDAVWTPGGRTDGVTVRAILRSPDDVTRFGEARAWSETVQADVLVADVPDPQKGDLVEIDGNVHQVQGAPVRDRERLTWTLDLRPI